MARKSQEVHFVKEMFSFGNDDSHRKTPGPGNYKGT